MPAGIKNKGVAARPEPDLSATALPGLGPDAAPPQPPDAGLSAAFRHALGGGHAEGHLPVPSLKTGQEIARRAKADKAFMHSAGAPQKASPRKTHIGPRSGHK